MRGHPLVALLIALAVLPFAVSALGYTHGFATEIALFAMVGLGFNLLLGYTGLLSFGHGLFFGFAAYAARSRKFISSRQVSSPRSSRRSR